MSSYKYIATGTIYQKPLLFLFLRVKRRVRGCQGGDARALNWRLKTAERIIQLGT